MPIAHLPERLRYMLSDVIAWILRSVVKYRRAVIDGNLEIAFPEKSVEERRKIRSDFYTNFTDVALEQTWLFTATNEQILARNRFLNPEIIDDLIKDGRRVMIAAGHHNNYEMGAATLALQFPIPISVIYARLANPYFDERVRETRGKFGVTLWPRGEIRQRMFEWSGKYDSFAVGFAFEQSPHATNRKYWVPFFGQHSAMTRGLEGYSRRLNAAVVFIYTTRVKRGYYDITIERITYDTNIETDGSITAKASALLEKAIREDPAGWLWSHRRWKLDIEKHRLKTDTVVDMPDESAV